MAPPLKSSTATPAVPSPSVQKASAAPPPKAPAAPTPQAPKGWVPRTPARVAPRGDGFATAPAKTAVPAKPAVSEETAVDLNDARQRAALAQRTSQVNEVSVTAGNAGDVCGGAAVVNAVVLNSGSPAAAKANADALRTVATQFGAWDAPGVDRAKAGAALDHLAAGKVSEADLHHLQQLAYAAGRALDPAERNDPTRTPGLNAGHLAGVLSQLQLAGARLSPDTRLIEVKGAGDDTGHWVAQAGGVLANSLSSVKVGREMLSPGAKQWESDVRLGAAGTPVEARLRTLGRGEGSSHAPPGQAYRFSVAPKPPESMFEKARDATANRVLEGFAEAKRAGPAPAK